MASHTVVVAPTTAAPLSALEERVLTAVAVAFGTDHVTDAAMRRSQHADYQANVALALAQKLKRPPRAVAEALLAKLDAGDLCESVTIAGPGYLNFVMRPEVLGAALSRMAGDPRLGVAPAVMPETVVIDYSSPNVAKELHVGHLRGTILGDAIARILETLGHRVIRQNHLGDWGTPFGMLIEHLVDAGASQLAQGEWTAFYKAARAKFDGDPAFADRARRRVVSLQAGDEATRTLWRTLVDQSLAYLDELYAKLGVTLKRADVCGESFYNEALAGVADDLAARGLAKDSDGALCVFPPGFKGKTGDPLPLIVRKADGGYGYAATDLAAIRYRTEKLGGMRLLYVVGAPQQLHLEMVYAAAKMAGWLAPPARAEHVAFGAVLGADKKMLKTRSGDTVALAQLLDEACAIAASIIAEKNPDHDPQMLSELSRKIGIGAVKYADLSTERIKDYVFDWDRMLAFDGNTGPYLQYAHARICSMLKKAGERPAGEIAPSEPAERALALELLDFDATVRGVAASLLPHRLCTYLYGVATAFTTFYEKCPVIRADTDAQRASRLALSALTASVLARGLGLLGIDAPEQM
jgi:arginyl-tRNA synthetase